MSILRQPLSYCNIYFQLELVILRRLSYIVDVPKKIVPPEVSKFFSEMGKKGGPAASKARWDGISEKKKKAAMRELVNKRWAKARTSKEQA